MSNLMKHTARAERKRTSAEPEFYMEAPEPPTPVENSGIGQSRQYVGPYSIFFDKVHQCTECGGLVQDTRAHERWHEGLVAA